MIPILHLDIFFFEYHIQVASYKKVLWLLSKIESLFLYSKLLQGKIHISNLLT